MAARPTRRSSRAPARTQPLVDVAGAIETLRTARLAPGWPQGLLALVLAALAAVLIANLSVTAGWLAIRLAVGGVIALTLGLAFGSTALVGLATVPVLAGATVGLDRPEGHAWGQTLVIGLLWYVTAELAWASIEERDATVRSSAVKQLRVREVATVVAVTVVVGSAAAGLATIAPIRTVLVRFLAVVAVLACVIAVGRVLASRARPDPTPDEDQDQDPTPDHDPRSARPDPKRQEAGDHAGDQDLQR